MQASISAPVDFPKPVPPRQHMLLMGTLNSLLFTKRLAKVITSAGTGMSSGKEGIIPSSSAVHVLPAV